MKLPIGWRRLGLSDVADFLDQKRVPLEKTQRENCSGPYPYYGASGVIDHVAKFIFDGDFVLLAEDGANILNRSTPIAFKANGRFWVNNHAHVLQPKSGIDHGFLIEYLESLNYERFNTGSTQPKLNRQVCEQIPVIVPPPLEQKRLGELSVVWGSAIEKTEQLITAKEHHYTHELSRIVSRSHHPRRHIGTFAHEASERNRGGNDARVLSVTNSRGFVLPENQFERRVASADLSNYKVVKRGQYAYNPSRINVGSIARLDGWDEGVLSPMYVVFQLDESKADSDYFLHWLGSHEARERIKKSAQGSVRETVSFSEFAALSVPLPDITKQASIARYLNTLQEEIFTLEAQAEALKTQKRGLMQKLLTGLWRIPIKEEENT